MQVCTQIWVHVHISKRSHMYIYCTYKITHSVCVCVYVYRYTFSVIWMCYYVRREHTSLFPGKLQLRFLSTSLSAHMKNIWGSGIKKRRLWYDLTLACKTEFCKAMKKARIYFFLQLPVTAELRYCKSGDIPSHRDKTPPSCWWFPSCSSAKSSIKLKKWQPFKGTNENVSKVAVKWQWIHFLSSSFDNLTYHTYTHADYLSLYLWMYFSNACVPACPI